ncbi:MAG: MraY family glycosyltransferase [Phycisphaerales bacterium]
MIALDPAWAPRFLVPSLVALSTGAVATWLVRTFARRYGIVNKPNPIVPQHTRPVAYLGGVGLGVGAVCGMLALWFTSPADTTALGQPLSAIGLCALLYLALGVFDDLVALKPAKKFVLQGLVALLAVLLGSWAPMTGVGLVDRAISWFWIVTLVNAFNLTDVCDGLVGSLSVAMFAIIALAYPPLAPICALLAASCGGFLLFNKPPATIFMGDAGSHLLGYLAAALTLAGIVLSESGVRSHVIAAPLLVGVPLFELTFLIVVRTRKGLAWWRGSPDHFSLRLQAGGMTRAQTDLIACVAAVALGAAALGMHQTHTLGQVIIAAGMLALSLIAARLLLRWEVKRPPAPSVATQPTSIAPAANDPKQEIVA